MAAARLNSLTKNLLRRHPSTRLHQIPPQVYTSPGLASNPVLSPQELVSCDDKDSGCHGGNPILTYEWLESHGLETNSAYPYTSGSGPTAGKDGNCSADLSQERWMVDDFKIITSSDDGPKSDAPIKEWVLNKGKSE